jgi:hypothetical protein
VSLKGSERPRHGVSSVYVPELLELLERLERLERLLVLLLWVVWGRRFFASTSCPLKNNTLKAKASML